MHEFYEVYDDDNVAGPKYRDYLDCKNYIRREKNDLKNIDSLRACLSSGSPQDPRRREEHQQSEIPKNGVLIPQNNLKCEEELKQSTYICTTTAIQGWLNPTDVLFTRKIAPEVNASHINSVKCTFQEVNHPFSCIVKFERQMGGKTQAPTEHCSANVLISTCGSRAPADAAIKCPNNQIRIEKIDHAPCNKQ